jgi:hypothetical protein
MSESPVCRNSEEIGNYIGIDSRQVPRMEKNHNLPAFKIDNQGSWKANKTSLNGWLADMEKQHQGEK